MTPPRPRVRLLASLLLASLPAAVVQAAELPASAPPGVDELRATFEAQERSAFPMGAEYEVRWRTFGAPAGQPDARPASRESVWVDPPRLAYRAVTGTPESGVESSDYFDGEKTILGTRTLPDGLWTVTTQTGYQTVFQSPCLWRFVMVERAPISSALREGNVDVIGWRDVEGRALLTIRVRSRGISTLLDLDPEMGLLPRRSSLVLDDVTRPPKGRYAAAPRLDFRTVDGRDVSFLLLTTMEVAETERLPGGALLAKRIETTFAPAGSVVPSATLVSPAFRDAPKDFALTSLFPGEGTWEDLDKLEMHYLGASPKLRAEKERKLADALARSAERNPPGASAGGVRWGSLAAGAALAAGVAWIVVRSLRRAKQVRP